MKKILVILTLIGFAFQGNAQDPEFTQFYANKLYLNPAFAGSNKCPRVVMNYRNQWPALTGNFVSMAVGYDQHIDAIHGGLGFLVVRDQAGQNTINSTRVSAIYSFNQPITRNFAIRFAGEATFFQKSLDWNKLTFGDMIDPKRGFVLPTNDTPRGGTATGVDFSAGIIGYSDRFFFGIAAHHLTQPEETLILGNSALPLKITGHAGATIEMASEAKISPNILFRQQANFTQLNMGLYVEKGNIVGGVWYRNKDAFIVTLGIHTDVMRIGYSYDVTISRLGAGTGGAHEISLAFDFPCKPKKRTFRTISCPSF